MKNLINSRIFLTIVYFFVFLWKWFQCDVSDVIGFDSNHLKLNT